MAQTCAAVRCWSSSPRTRTAAATVKDIAIEMDLAAGDEAAPADRLSATSAASADILRAIAATDAARAVAATAIGIVATIEIEIVIATGDATIEEETDEIMAEIVSVIVIAIEIVKGKYYDLQIKSIIERWI